MEILNVEPHVKARLDRVAQLMLDIYKTMADMDYLSPEWILPGPHSDASSLIRLRGEIDDSILYLYSVLPYVDPAGAMDVDFYQGGEFARYDQGQDLDTREDPFYAERMAYYLTPSMTPLSNIGNHDTAIIYGAKTHRIWTISQSDVKPGPGPWISGDDTLDSYSDGGDQSSIHEYDSVDRSNPEEKDRAQAYQNIDGRPAEGTLQGIIDSYKKLDEVPGGGEHSPLDWDPDLTEPLYRKHGWLTGEFNRRPFHVERLRNYAATEVQDAVSSAWNDFHFLERAMDGQDGERARKLENLKQKLHRCFPDGEKLADRDLPLWETERLRITLQENQDALQRLQQEAQVDGGNNDLDRSMRLQLQQAQKEVTRSQDAYNASRDQTEALFPNTSFVDATGWETLDKFDNIRRDFDAQ